MAKKRRKSAVGDESLKTFGESLLAAPESVTGSTVEQRKYAARKARALAMEKQIASTKLDVVPSGEDLLADIIRVADDKEVNQFWRMRSISPQRYRLYGHYHIDHVYELYGQFAHAKQIAGLEDQPGTRDKKAARANQSRREHLLRYADRHILPHVVKDPALERDLTGTKLVLSISDTHATFLDPFTWWCFLSACRDLQPDIVYFNGDILEGGEISRFPKIPGWTVSLQMEFDFARSMFEQTREVVGPDTDIIWGAGNHGLDRLAAYLSQQTPALAGLRTMKFDALAGLGDLNIKLAQGGKFISPEGTEDDSPGMLLYDFYRIHHGTRLGPMPAHAELKDAGRSGQSGHIHRGGLVFGVTEADRTKSWMQTPMGCGPRAGRAYIKGIANWQRGFGAAWLHPGGIVRQFPVICDDGVCILEGYVYERRDLKDPDPSTNWLETFEVPS